MKTFINPPTTMTNKQGGCCADCTNSYRSLCNNTRCTCHTTTESEEWKETIEICFLTERMTDWPVPTVRVNPDTLKTVVQTLLTKQKTSTLKEVREVIEGMKKPIESLGDSYGDIQTGYNGALTDLFTKLEELN